jgi:NADPH:quinone reductase-like Zn-dependent oxidoreductase
VVKDPARIASVVDPATVLGFGGRYVFVRPNPEQLAELSEKVDAGRLRIEVARTFGIEETGEAHALVESGHVRGKVVLTL